MDDKLKLAVEQFILQRVNDCGAKGSESLQGMITISTYRMVGFEFFYT